jgi:hypothetical protein
MFIFHLNIILYLISITVGGFPSINRRLHIIPFDGYSELRILQTTHAAILSKSGIIY